MAVLSTASLSTVSRIPRRPTHTITAEILLSKVCASYQYLRLVCVTELILKCLAERTKIAHRINVVRLIEIDCFT